MSETQEYPKALYLHPADKTQEHRYIIVNTPEEKDEALAKGYRLNPHVPVVEEPVDDFVADVQPVDAAPVEAEPEPVVEPSEPEAEPSEEQPTAE